MSSISSPKISVVIPSYNKVKYIRQTLDSILSQNYKNFEVIIYDGGSTDGTLEIIKNYSKKYPKFVEYESKKDKGQLDAINKGFKKASGDIYTFINADDVYESGAFESVVSYYLEYPSALWFAGKGIVINDKNVEITAPISSYKSFLLSLNFYFVLLITNYLMQPSVFLTKKMYKKYGPFTGSYDFVTEYEMWLRLAQVKMPIVINKTLSKFRIENSSKTKLLSNALLKEDEKIVKKYTNNVFIVFLHLLHNWGRLFINNFI